MPNKLTRAGLTRAAEMLRAGADGIALLRTVMAVECRGSGFDAQGRPLILYEPHVAWRCLRGPQEQLGWQSRGLAYQNWGEKPYPKDSYPRYLAACQINPEVAAKACSWGLGQILGENFKAAGYSSATQMAIAMAMGEDEQALAQARFIAANPKMLAALIGHDWAGFASRYNGPGYAKNGYDGKLARAYFRFKADPWAGFNGAASAAPAGQTQADTARAATNQAIAVSTTAGAGGATIAVSTSPSPPAPPAKTETVAPAPLPVTPAPKSHWPEMVLAIGVVLIIGFVITRAIKSRPTERVVTEG